ncbi:MAG: hypothetical protein AMS15_00065 [Planctomycetes bacterium DG_23]|nr:MAG: hypothetical protein AMS15_00065 [Planctomycetes bacterium DG_23]
MRALCVLAASRYVPEIILTGGRTAYMDEPTPPPTQKWPRLVGALEPSRPPVSHIFDSLLANHPYQDVRSLYHQFFLSAIQPFSPAWLTRCLADRLPALGQQPFFLILTKKDLIGMILCCPRTVKCEPFC